MSFFKQKVSFFFQSLNLFSVSWEILLLYFLAETLYAFDKSSTLKSKFSDLPLLTLKFTKFLMSFLEPRVSFHPNFSSLFSVVIHNFSVLFHPNIYMFWIKESNQSANFQTFNCSHDNLAKSLSHFSNHKSVFL